MSNKLAVALKAHYDFIVCGSGSSGSVVARRLAENPAVDVLLLEAGGSDGIPNIMDASAWPSLRGGDQDWSFKARPNPRLNGRSIPMSMGRVLGGGSGINVMMWSRGHKNDWDRLAAEVGDDGWNYRSVLRIYRRIEDWHGEPDADRRGVGGPLFVQPAPDPHPLAPAMLEAFAAAGVPTFADQNGVMMEGDGGCSLTNLCVRDGRRQSIFRAYVYPYIDRPNLTVFTEEPALRQRGCVDSRRLGLRGLTGQIDAKQTSSAGWPRPSAASKRSSRMNESFQQCFRSAHGDGRSVI